MKLRIPFVKALAPHTHAIAQRRGGLTPSSFSPALKVKLLVFQATPFCNVDCAYCYLPDRSSTARMTRSVIEATVRQIVDSGLSDDRLCVVWHSGEPLAAGIDFYRDAFACIREVVGDRCPVQHSIQTNATLIDQDWCDLFAQHAVRVGVSVDGPAFIHDRYRKTRDGKGTHAAAMRGVQCLRANGLPFHAIAVVTATSLRHPDDIFRFFLEEGFTEVGFNIEEREGVHPTSSIGAAEERDVLPFLERMLELSQAAARRMRIRELDESTKVVLGGLGTVTIDGETFPRNAQVLPLEILTVDHAGNFSTFSPELIGQRNAAFGNFVFGNVLGDRLLSMFGHPHFVAAQEQILAGVRRCRRECEFFDLCGGGAPANKLYENGSFESAETAYCRSVVIAPLRVMMSELERQLQPPLPRR
ncbi:MAG: cyclophane-forming radical SAM/SPASM peptide maturase GrrM/OscB [Burkholderiales bacterium]